MQPGNSSALRLFVFQGRLSSSLYNLAERTGPRCLPLLTPRVAKHGFSSSQTRYSKQGNSPRIPLRLMPLGGSITYGIGSSTGNGYREKLNDILAARGHQTTIVGSRKSGTMANNDNEGWRGYRIDQIHEKAVKSAARYLPNLFTVNAGANDCLQDYEIQTVGVRLEALVEELWEIASPGATVVLSTLVVAVEDGMNSRVLRVNEQIRDLVERKVADGKRIVLADLYSPRGPQVGDLVDDGIHPSDEGYVKIAEIWADSIGQAARTGMLQHPLAGRNRRN
ncbi:SGNH/GDSL hydrolase family protein [Aspergillus puulaauensis]|uniref:SGNH hydrolase-type esterase domain-containing protein n=1 Tax=Aspergillus puulaauensis TaxID=1220207 RepID=A0A7R8AM40_9EURO|nr:uncharacterized protein APUU_40410S [Aspergillus puulaauensis]BCS23966.1 hypothetical protein APUU_40410S [Aspergillus puulaauensis]